MRGRKTGKDVIILPTSLLKGINDCTHTQTSVKTWQNVSSSTFYYFIHLC